MYMTPVENPLIKKFNACTRFSANVPQICSIKVLCQLDHALVVYLPVLGDWGCVDLQDVKASLLIWKRNL